MKNQKTLLLLVCIALILTGLLWGRTTSGQETDNNNCNISDNNALLEVLSPEGSEIIRYCGFTVSFNPRFHQPDYVAWELTRDEAEADSVSRKGYDFASDPDIEGCAVLADYRRSGFSRGHMVPAGDMKWSPEAMRDCFYLTNICPQTSALNEGAWGALEKNCRRWARRDSAIIIICGPILTDRLTRSIGQTPVPVPERFFKVILAPGANPPRAIGFIMNNGKVEGGMQAAVTTVDEVERITGYDFFSALPDSIEETIESQSSLPAWNL